ncbi:Carboxylesterase family protein [Actinoalloteichus cyanogriseus DSM 43889]|uniref:Carboxylesterase family protein n=1 Tax=Actinoalloteichus caeruleus DSM 43889 TaxID=1120930 RepID=A0ABT1JCR3_ACTCY|nr:Carboxylesterase family protein [Actinoalloteichus caeruleus DSM 43889]
MTEHVLVHLSTGPVRGRRLDGHSSFHALPYAAPPLAELRWRAPAR